MSEKIHTCAELTEYVDEIGFLPLLDMGIDGWSAEAVTDDDCQYTVLPDGGWEWPLWQWKGPVIRESGCAYGKFFNGKAAFVSRRWWPHFCNCRRGLAPCPVEGSIDDTIRQILMMGGSMITRDLRKACGFSGPKMRSRFDSYVTRLQMRGYVVTEDFVYPHDRHGNQYGWGWALLTTPESLFGREACHPGCSPQESLQVILDHFARILPGLTREQAMKLVAKV